MDSKKSRGRGVFAVLGLTLMLIVASGPAARALPVAQESGETGSQDAEELRLSLSEAVRLAFEQNLDIAVVDYDRGVARGSTTAARGAFDPVFRVGTPGTLPGIGSGGGFGGPSGGAGGLGFTRTESPSTSQLAGADVVVNESLGTETGLGQSFPFGLRYEVSYGVTRTTTNSAFTSLDPAWDNTLGFAVTQPLLRGRGEEASAVQLLLARQNEDVADESFRTEVEAVLEQVLQAYWELVFAQRDVEVRELSLQLAREQLERTRAQVEVGLIAPVQETQAEVAVAQRRSDLITARNGLESAADQLRALLRAEELPAGWGTEIVPTDEPRVEPVDIDEAEAIATARENRPEMAAARARIRARRVETDAARNEMLPRLDLVASLSYTGIGGDLLIRDEFFGPVVEVIEGGYPDAAGQLFDLEVPSWRLGFNFSLPIGNRTARGNFARATLEEDRARTELERLEQRVTLDVRQAFRDLEAASELVESTSVARELAARQLEIEEDRFEVGMSTNFEVLEFQDDLAQARVAELRALIDHRQARAALARATGTLLPSYGIDLR